MAIGIGRVVVSVGLIVLVTAACGGRAKADKKDMQRAEALFAEARAAVARADVATASARYGQADSLMGEVRHRSRKAQMGESDLPDGPMYRGQSARRWQEEWKASFAADIDTHLDAIGRAAQDGKLTWTEGRDFVAHYGGKALEARWQGARSGVDAAVSARVTEDIVLDCDAPADDTYCDALRALIAPKLVKPVSTERNLTGEVRTAAFAVVTMSARYAGGRDYEQVGGKDNPGGVVIANIPERLEVLIAVKRARASTTWDAGHTLVVSEPVPEKFDVNEMTATRTAHLEKLRDKMKATLQALEPQRVLSQ